MFRVVASSFVALVVLGCEMVPEDPCEDILRNPFPGTEGGPVDPEQVLQAMLTDGIRAQRCMANMLNCFGGRVDPITGQCRPTAAPPTLPIQLPAPTPMPLPDPLDPNMMMDPIDPNDLPTVGCSIEFEPLEDLGPASFLIPSEQNSIPGFQDTFGYPADRRIKATQPEQSPTCALPGIRLRVDLEPGLPLIFVDRPPVTTRLSEIGLTAKDSRGKGGCRPGVPLDEPRPACISRGEAVFIYDEERFVMPGMDPNQMWPMMLGSDATTEVRLTVFTPSKTLLTQMFGILFS